MIAYKIPLQKVLCGLQKRNTSKKSRDFKLAPRESPSNFPQNYRFLDLYISLLILGLMSLISTS